MDGGNGTNTSWERNMKNPGRYFKLIKIIFIKLLFFTLLLLFIVVVVFTSIILLFNIFPKTICKILWSSIVLL